MKGTLASALALALAAAAAPAGACGACAEDKVAATYDHATVTAAAAARKLVVFCEVSGTREFTRVRQAAQRTKGVQAASVRVSKDPSAVSFVIDPALQTPQSAVKSVQAAMPRGGKLAIVKVMGGGSPG